MVDTNCNLLVSNSFSPSFAQQQLTTTITTIQPMKAAAQDADSGFVPAKLVIDLWHDVSDAVADGRSKC